MMASVCQAAGYRTGFFLSPHLKEYTERFRLDGEDISREDFVDLTEAVWPLIPRVEQMAGRPTEFELLTAAAFLYFAERQAEIVVLEVGLGGRWDSTNVVKDPLLSIIVNISLEHQQYLGDTLEAIAGEKAGVIKEGCPILTAERNPRILKLFADEAARKSSGFFSVYGECRWDLAEESMEGQSFHLYTPAGEYKDLRIPLLGAHQLANAAAVVYGAEILRESCARIDEAAVREGLRNVSWPGRLEVLGRAPFVLLDGAHNPGAAETLREWLAAKRSGFPKVYLVTGMLDDKDQAGWAALMDEWVDRVVVTRPGSYRASKWRDFARYFRSADGRVQVVEDPREALRMVLGWASEADLVLLAGSFYLAAEFREYFKN
jgi:dihydrofolate synthase/folylpolyglutamate synthase